MIRSVEMAMPIRVADFSGTDDARSSTVLPTSVDAVARQAATPEIFP
jgi:hypothetical protein